MTEEYKLKIYDSKTNTKIRDRTNKIINDLSLFGRFIGNADRDNRTVSRRFGVVVKNGVVHFGWNPNSRKSFIILDPNYEIIRDGQHYVKIRRR